MIPQTYGWKLASTTLGQWVHHPHRIQAALTEITERLRIYQHLYIPSRCRASDQSNSLVEEVSRQVLDKTRPSRWLWSPPSRTRQPSTWTFGPTAKSQPPHFFHELPGGTWFTSRCKRWDRLVAPVPTHFAANLGRPRCNTCVQPMCYRIDTPPHADVLTKLKREAWSCTHSIPSSIAISHNLQASCPTFFVVRAFR
jgi:hypothetical protein